MLARCGTGIGTIGLAGVLADAHGQNPGVNTSGSSKAVDPLAVKAPHFAAKAKHVVHLFMNGGPSQVDTFDPKPMLDKYHGKPIPTGNLRTERKTGAAMRSPYSFKKYGKSGLEVSEIFARTAAHIDDMCVIRSMYADVPNHEPSLLLMNCGEGRQPRPSLGSWLTYGLGSENRNLPGFVVMCPGGYPIVTTQNWRSAFLPGVYQGTYIDSQHTQVDKLISYIRNTELTLDKQRDQLDLVAALNEKHLKDRANDAQLESRIRTFELAFRMQSEAADVFDLTRETKKIREMYGETVHGRQLLLARRMIERGVRVVQLWSGAGQPWDNHDGIAAAHKTLAAQWDQPIAAFLSDLKQRGLFDETLVQWGGEFGRTPVAELPALNGRDHNHYGFTCWLAGGGVKGGTVIGATDEFGFAAVENKVHVHDLHATMLHLLGFDHEKLTYRYAGRDFRLTDVHGRVVKEMIA
ncbi:MAG: DUF1501 domain-containing protein [Planctomycetaceae bacterium]|nr:DUF1501 domain-containing protein [Planctomycetaceae bacterium]